MLNLIEEDRAFLRTLGALTLNSEGEETLVGLTSAESHLLVNFKAKARTAGDFAERVVYDQVLRLHLRARLDALNKTAGYLGGSGIIGYREGDVVRLKCGGPALDVVGLVDAYPFKDGPEPGVFCVWEESCYRYEQVYPLYAVESVQLASCSARAETSDGAKKH
ncbi:hypothetical protein ASD15_14175 [Massilia sp. Root351]|uniref:hypothetical protein n=1 Tax=Massilia sp. Root351 TaxID=1736522 RepID=UPI00070F09A7|nr:hypothetical protein [Massilia sp. Root351]KQV81023.1 hypothetical protein ASD15_14175 [Massilia sp. Root351]